MEIDYKLLLESIFEWYKDNPCPPVQKIRLEWRDGGSYEYDFFSETSVTEAQKNLGDES